MNVRRQLLLATLGACLVGIVAAAFAVDALGRNTARKAFVERLRVEAALLGELVQREEQVSLQDFAVRSGRRLGIRVTLVA